MVIIVSLCLWLCLRHISGTTCQNLTKFLDTLPVVLAQSSCSVSVCQILNSFVVEITFSYYGPIDGFTIA